MSYENQEIVLEMLNKDRINTIDKTVTRLPLAVHAFCLLTPGILHRETDNKYPIGSVNSVAKAN